MVLWQTLLYQISVEMKLDQAVVIVKLLVDYMKKPENHLYCKGNSTLWSGYIDIIDLMEIDDGDRLRIT